MNLMQPKNPEENHRHCDQLPAALLSQTNRRNVVMFYMIGQLGNEYLYNIRVYNNNPPILAGYFVSDKFYANSEAFHTSSHLCDIRKDWNSLPQKWLHLLRENGSHDCYLAAMGLDKL